MSRRLWVRPRHLALALAVALFLWAAIATAVLAVRGRL